MRNKRVLNTKTIHRGWNVLERRGIVQFEEIADPQGRRNESFQCDELRDAEMFENGVDRLGFGHFSLQSLQTFDHQSTEILLRRSINKSIDLFIELHRTILKSQVNVKERDSLQSMFRYFALLDDCFAERGNLRRQRDLRVLQRTLQTKRTETRSSTSSIARWTFTLKSSDSIDSVVQT